MATVFSEQTGRAWPLCSVWDSAELELFDEGQEPGVGCGEDGQSKWQEVRPECDTLVCGGPASEPQLIYTFLD